MSILELCPELTFKIVSFCDASSIVALSATCRKLNVTCRKNEERWRQLCYVDFDVLLTTCGAFENYYTIYKYVYLSRILLGSHIYVRHYLKMNKKPVPNWLLAWASLSNKTPRMIFGRHRITRRITGNYLRQLETLPCSQVMKVWGFNLFDLIYMYPCFIGKNTLFYQWHQIRNAAIIKFGNEDKFMLHMLTKCHRSRGYIERYFQQIKGSYPLLPMTTMPRSSNRVPKSVRDIVSTDQ